MKELEQLYRKTRCKYIKILSGLLRNSDDAEDVFHSAVVRAVNYYPTFDSNISKIENWFSRIVFNEYSRWLRKNKNITVDIELCDLTVDMNMDNYMSILTSFKGLEPKLKNVVELIYIKGYTTSDVCNLTNLTTSEVGYLIRKFKSILKDTNGAGL